MIRGAFTLIEVLIAIGLGLLIALTAFAAFDGASRTIARAGHIGKQNQIIITGIQHALEELDSWSGYNDPENPFSGVLHIAAPDAANYRHSLPFNTLPLASDVLHHHPADPRWWYRYKMINNIGNGPKEDQLPDFSFYGKAGDPLPQGFLHDWMPYLIARLGHYAFLDYHPPGIPIASADAGGNDHPMFRGSGRYFAGNQPDYQTWPYDHIIGGAGSVAALGGHAFGVVNTTSAISNGTNRQLYGIFGQSVGALFRNQIAIRRLMPVGMADVQDELETSLPLTLPDLQVQVRHFVAYGQFNRQASVRLHDRVHGETLSVAFTALGTTLRGARISRNLDP